MFMFFNFFPFSVTQQRQMATSVLHSSHGRGLQVNGRSDGCCVAGKTSKNTKSPLLPDSGKVQLSSLILSSHPETKLFKHCHRNRNKGKQQVSFTFHSFGLNNRVAKLSEMILGGLYGSPDFQNSTKKKYQYKLSTVALLITLQYCDTWYNHLLSQTLTPLMPLTSGR